METLAKNTWSVVIRMGWKKRQVGYTSYMQYKDVEYFIDNKTKCHKCMEENPKIQLHFLSYFI